MGGEGCNPTFKWCGGSDAWVVGGDDDVGVGNPRWGMMMVTAVTSAGCKRGIGS